MIATSLVFEKITKKSCIQSNELSRPTCDKKTNTIVKKYDKETMAKSVDTSIELKNFFVNNKTYELSLSSLSLSNLKLTAIAEKSIESVNRPGFSRDYGKGLPGKICRIKSFGFYLNFPPLYFSL